MGLHHSPFLAGWIEISRGFGTLVEFSRSLVCNELDLNNRAGNGSVVDVGHQPLCVGGNAGSSQPICRIAVAW